MANLQPKITSVKEAVLMDSATQKATPHMVVTYTVGTHGPFQETFPKAGFDPNVVNQKVAEHAQKLGQLTGI